MDDCLKLYPHGSHAPGGIPLWHEAGSVSSLTGHRRFNSRIQDGNQTLRSRFSCQVEIDLRESTSAANL